MGLVGGMVSASSCSSGSVMPSTNIICVGEMVVASLVVSGARSILLTSLDGSLMLLFGLKGIWFCSCKNCCASPDSFSMKKGGGGGGAGFLGGIGLLYLLGLVGLVGKF